MDDMDEIFGPRYIIVYQMQCRKCQRKYRGQTLKSIYERENEHSLDLLNEKESSVLFEHDGKQYEIEVSILKRCFGEPSTRLITEAVLIENGLILDV